MCYQICNILRMVRQVQRSQIRFIPSAVRLLIFMAYIFIGLLYVSPLRGSITRVTLPQSYLTPNYLQDWPFVHMGSAHVCTRYLYIYMCVRMKPLIRKGAARTKSLHIIQSASLFSSYLAHSATFFGHGASGERTRRQHGARLPGREHSASRTP